MSDSNNGGDSPKKRMTPENWRDVYRGVITAALIGLATYAVQNDRTVQALVMRTGEIQKNLDDVNRKHDSLIGETERKLVEIQRASTSTERSVAVIQQVMVGGLTRQIDVLEKRVIELESARNQNMNYISDIKSSLAGIQAQLVELTRGAPRR